MKLRDSGMPDECYWESLFDLPLILDRLGINSASHDVAELGCGYGTFTLPIAQAIRGTIYTFDIDPEMVARANERTRQAGANNVICRELDVMEHGFDVPNLVAVALLFNILHCEEPERLLDHAAKAVRQHGRVLIIPWRYDPTTPRGPTLDIRPKPEQIVHWAVNDGQLVWQNEVLQTATLALWTCFRPPLGLQLSVEHRRARRCMMELERFRQEVQRRVAAADLEPKWTTEAALEYMAELEPRRQQFVELTRRWVADVIEPCMAAVAEPFANAEADRNTHDDRSTWWFGYCERYPVTARLEISVAHNEPIDQIQLRYELDITPTFFKYDAHDKLVMPLNAVDDQAAAKWVERKLLEFLATYLTIDRGRDDFDDEPVTDPVCGMRIRRSAAAASSDYKGHPYFFCSTACRSQFDDGPQQFVTVRI